MRNKILIVGGAFNPPTVAHIEIPLQIAKKMKLDSILYLPVGNEYNKSTLIDIEHRKNMLQIAINNSIKKRLKENPNDNISTYIDFLEAYHYRILSTIESLDILEREWNADLYFFCGADNLATLPYWDNADKLLEHYHIVVYSREGWKIEEIIVNNDLLLNAYKNKRILCIPIETLDYANVSSTLIRDTIKDEFPDDDNKTILNRYLDDDVLKYIKDNNLYEV